MVENDDVEISDDSGMTSKECFSIKEIILRQIRKIGDISCKEFTGSYWQKKPIKTGSGIMFTEVYHEDVRQAYCNAVDFLIDIVYPLGDEDIKNYLKEFEGFNDKITKDKDKDKKDKDKKQKTDKEGNSKKEKIDIKDKLILKRQTFRQINIMFESNEFWKGTQGYNE